MLPVEGFVAHAIEWCGRIARNPAPAIFATKRAVVDGLRLPLDDGLKLEGRMFVEINSSAEARAAIAEVARPDES